MALTCCCASCGQLALCVRRAGGRWCLDCVRPLEFKPGGRVRCYVRRRIWDDDRRDDRESAGGGGLFTQTESSPALVLEN